MSSVFNDRLDKYGYQTNAEALFLHSAKVKDSKGLRVLLPDKGMEFSDGSYVGTGAFLIDPRRPDTHPFCVTLKSLRSRRFFLLSWWGPQRSHGGKAIWVGYHYKSTRWKTLRMDQVLRFWGSRLRQTCRRGMSWFLSRRYILIRGPLHGITSSLAMTM